MAYKNFKYNSKEDYFAHNGFNADGSTYSVYGDNTYAVKDQLKETGFKWSPIFQWHSAEELEVPNGYQLVSFNANDYMTWDERSSTMIENEGAKDAVSAKFYAMKGPDLSEYIQGEIGQRIRNIEVVLTSIRGFNGRFGWTNILTFKQGDNVMTWFTSTDPDVEEGYSYLLTGTIKKFEEYRGTKTTQLSRVILKEI